MIALLSFGKISAGENFVEMLLHKKQSLLIVIS
jgi:hypothetical protein